jgi:transposase-like protein
MEGFSVKGRWTYLRKATVVETVLLQKISKADACRLYDLSAEELEQWITLYVAGGERGLVLSKLQEQRRARAA